MNPETRELVAVVAGLSPWLVFLILSALFALMSARR
jgi:hypothetical protein